MYDTYNVQDDFLWLKCSLIYSGPGSREDLRNSLLINDLVSKLSLLKTYHNLNNKNYLHSK